MWQRFSGNLQSSHPFDRETTNLVYRRTHTKKSIKMVNNTVTPMAGPAVDSGFTRFGMTPGGGFTTGIWQRSVPGGRSAKLMISRDYAKTHEDMVEGIEGFSRRRTLQGKMSCRTRRRNIGQYKTQMRNLGSRKNKIAYQPPKIGNITVCTTCRRSKDLQAGQGVQPRLTSMVERE